MKKNVVNPWKWQEKLAFAQAVEISHASQTLYCAGQAAVDADGVPIPADMGKQIQICFDNLETVLGSAGYTLADVVRINYFTTSIGEFFEAYHQATNRLAASLCIPSSTLVEVSSLAMPGLMVEIEATAVR